MRTLGRCFISLIFFVFLTLPACNGPTDQNSQKICPPPTDTTSHNFTWRIDTLGVGNASQLNDVFIIDEHNVWAVGEIHTNETDRFDSSGKWVQPFNIARWNGQQWNLSRILFNCKLTNPNCAGDTLLFTPGRAVFATSPTDIWIAAGNIHHYNGNDWQEYGALGAGFSTRVRIWGTSNSNLYSVGNGGSIYLYNGTTWHRLNSGTTTDIKDIWGDINCRGEYEILAVASYGSQIPQAKQLLRISGTTVSEISSEGLPLSLGAVWFEPKVRYLIGGAGLFSTNTLNQPWDEDLTQPLYYVSSIRGLRTNDVVIAGGLGHLSHFNGSTWRHFTGSELPQIQGNYISVSLHSRLVVAVGFLSDGTAIATIGRR